MERNACSIQLVPGCHLVASGRLGFELSDSWDCNVYLLACGDGEAVLIDSGGGRGVDSVVCAIEDVLGRTARLAAVVLTHSHPDHSGGASGISRRFDVPVYAHASAVSDLAAGDENAVGLTQARADGLYPADHTQSAIDDVRAFPSDGLRVGRATVQAIETPSHSPDHLVFTVELDGTTLAFTGDLVFSRGRTASVADSSPDAEDFIRSIEAVRGVAPTRLMPGHCEPVLNNSIAHLETAISALRAGRPIELVQ